MSWGAMCALVCALVLATSAADEKRAEMSPMPFVLGSRYGRSEPRMLSPRNDRFFMGSRYGKRSEGLPSLALSQPMSQPMLCSPSGLYSLYRCTPAANRNFLSYNAKRSEETREEMSDD